MDSSIDEPSSTSDATVAAANPSPPPLQRMGSGASAVIDPLPPAEPGVEAESRKLPSSQYKGVVPQPNGRWGAQIYEKHQRVWLGTFNLERDAARAYDVAAHRFRGRDAATNFPPLFASCDCDEAAGQELAFILSRSKAEVVDMLRKHTYSDELRQSRRKSPAVAAAASGAEKPAREHLFEKAVTPSDVGKLNRLVIPKQHAEKHFPLAPGGCNSGELLSFEDGGGKVWRFRYSYWNSSQSYVLTKGWSRFVKEKGLKAGDSVGFYRSKGMDRQLYIECRKGNATAGAGGGDGYLPLPTVDPVKVMRLFGVDIVAATVDGSGWNVNGKRRMESMEAAAAPPPPAEVGWWKKRCIVAL